MEAMPRECASTDASSAPVCMSHTRIVLSPDAETLGISPACHPLRNGAHVLLGQCDSIDSPTAMTVLIAPDNNKLLEGVDVEDAYRLVLSISIFNLNRDK